MKKASLILISLLYIIAGVNHFLNPAFYLEIMPNYIPVPLIMIYFSGVIEIILGLSLYNKKIQTTSAWLIILMLLLFLPVHIKMLNDAWYLLNVKFIFIILRLPFQFVLIYWVYSTFNLKFNYFK